MSDDQPQIGNPDAAQDLYGLGVRVGFYLQALGMILYNYGDKEDYGKGLKIASGSIAISILASWFVFAARGLFSPCEAIIVLLVLMSLSFPAKTTLLNPRTIVGETIGLLALLVVELGTCSGLVWTFARLVDTLPTLETDNVVFFFSKVAINGWFRYLALAYFVIDTLTSISFAYKVTRVTAIAWHCYVRGRIVGDVRKLARPKKESPQPIRRAAELLQELTRVSQELTRVEESAQRLSTEEDARQIPSTVHVTQELERVNGAVKRLPRSGEDVRLLTGIEEVSQKLTRIASELTRVDDAAREIEIEAIIKWGDMRIGIQLLRWLTWILVIVAVELTVRWNHLPYTADLQAPGQLIPLVTGIIILIDSFFVAGRQKAPRYVHLCSKFGVAAIDGANECIFRLMKVLARFWNLVITQVHRTRHQQEGNP